MLENNNIEETIAQENSSEQETTQGKKKFGIYQTYGKRIAEMVEKFKVL